MSWMDQAKCEGMDPEKFTPMENETKKERTAKQVCKGCPVRMDCLHFALETDSIGIFAGTNYTERQKMMAMLPSLRPSRPVSVPNEDARLKWDESQAPLFHRSDRIPTLQQFLPEF